jgi:hypothetical protein
MKYKSLIGNKNAKKPTELVGVQVGKISKKHNNLVEQAAKNCGKSKRKLLEEIIDIYFDSLL